MSHSNSNKIDVNDDDEQIARREMVLKSLREVAGINLDLVEKQHLNLTTIISVVTILSGIAFILLEVYIKDSKVPIIVGKSITGAGF